MPERKNRNGRKLVETLYNANVLPDGNLMSINPIDSIKLKIATDQAEEGSMKEKEGL